MSRRRPSPNALPRIVTEVAFIIFLFYANLLMGQYIRGPRPPRNLFVAIRNIVTLDDLVIGLVCAFIGHMIFDRLRRDL